MTLDQIRDVVLSHRAAAMLGVGHDEAAKIESSRMFVDSVAVTLRSQKIDAGIHKTSPTMLLLRDGDEITAYETVLAPETEHPTVIFEEAGMGVDPDQFELPGNTVIGLPTPMPTPTPIPAVPMPPEFAAAREQMVGAIFDGKPLPPEEDEPDVIDALKQLTKETAEMREGVRGALTVIAQMHQALEEQLVIIGDGLDAINAKLKKGIKAKTKIWGKTFEVELKVEDDEQPQPQSDHEQRES